MILILSQYYHGEFSSHDYLMASQVLLSEVGAIGDLWQVYQIKWLWSNDSKNNLRIHHMSQNLDLQRLEMFAFLESA